jgi:TM2 domain-containing membrane protein YozV
MAQCMKKESKLKSKVVAALLSGLVFPGAGQYYMGRRRLALALVVLAAAGGLLYLDYALDQASAVADQVLAGRVALDPAAIAAQIEARPTPLSVTIGAALFGLCWVGSVLEALLVKPRP